MESEKARVNRLSYHVKYNKEWYANNKKDRIKQIYDRRKAILRWIADIKKQNKCKLCPESDWVCLDFHHKNKDEKNYNIAEMVKQGFGVDRILEEIEKCDIICSNCHRKRHRNDYVV